MWKFTFGNYSNSNMNIWNYKTLRRRLFTYLYLILCISTSVNSVSIAMEDVDDSISISADKQGCTCSWTKWMNSGQPDNKGEDETLATLRLKGNNFCSSPVDIQCYNLASNSLESGFGTVCDINLGLRCSFLCDDYAVRVACCYCPPEKIGPEFLINSQTSSGGCMKATAQNDLPSVTLSGICDLEDNTQLWVWVSKYTLKNMETQQCLVVDGGVISVEDCDLDKKSQKWKYMDRNSLLELYDTDTYLTKQTDNKLRLTTSRSADSKWLAKVEEGVTSMKNMRNPKCQPPILTPGNGTMSCTLGQYVSSKCTFSCDYGYKLPEDVENPSVCTDDGEFTVDTPFCDKIICNPPISLLDHGTVTCSNGNNLDSSCVHECDEGYVLVGSQQLLCMDNGKWNYNRPPTCERVLCEPDLVKDGLQDGTVNCTDHGFFNSKCTYKCLVGYELIGPNIRKCQLNKEWDQSKPICQKIQCPGISAHENSVMACSDGTDYLSTCRFTCNIGYTMVGSATTTCNVDKAWSSEEPNCEKKTCNVLEDPKNGEMDCDDRTYGSRCSFSCHRGYRIEGNQILECTDEGWNYGAPKCTQITCSRQVNPTNGAVSCTNNELFGSICTFTCAHGFKLSASISNMQCTDKGWSSTSPTCEKITCPTMPNIRKGRLLCTNENYYGSDCYTICDQGYDVAAGAQNGFVNCQLNGEWSSSAVTCKRIQCRDINSLRQGIMTCSDMNNFNSTCTFQCKEGYNLLGAKQAKCTKSGWDAQTPNCGRLTCAPPLAQPSNGQIKCRTSGLPVCTFSCNPGYRLIGPSRSECQSDETWSVTEIPICKIIECTTYQRSPAHGNVSCDKANTYDSLCEFDCEMGYELQGKRNTRCKEDQTWDQEPPTCERISCLSIVNPVQGKVRCRNGAYYNSRCTFQCNEGYKLVGKSSTQCFLNSTWSNPAPYCERITCSPSYSNPSNGQVTCSDANNYDSSCDFTCEEGFSLEGSTISMCLESGWNLSEPPTCKKITCPQDESEIPHGSGRCDRANEYKSVCRYDCNHGYEVIGAKTIECTEQGTWSGKKPQCKEIQCPRIPQLLNGDVICRNRNMYNSECYFICTDGFTRTPDTSTVTCMENKRWKPIGFPTCVVGNKTEKITATSTARPTTVRTTKRTTTSTNKTTTPTTVTTTTTTEAPVTRPVAETVVVPRVTKAPPTSQISGEISTMPSRITTEEGFTTKPETIPREEITAHKDTGVTYSDKDPGEQSGGFPVIIIAVVSAVVILIVILIVGFILWKRRSKKKTKYHNGPMSSMKDNNRYDHTELGPLIPNGNSIVKKNGLISMDRLEMEYNRRHADDDKMFREEYHSLVDGTGSKEAGGLAQNKEKNRYTNILPYDHSRVVLPKIGIENDSDYINASFVDGYKHKGKFIAAQGPKENTTDDFWRMIWEQNISTIIMATNLEERKEQKCALYWPQAGSESYGDLMVSFMGENHLVDYTIRLFTVQRAQGTTTMSSKRNITQYHFTSWPDFGVPKSPSGILKFLRKIKHSSPTGYGPIVVHCSAGVGRTGTFICIDAMMDMISRENKIDVFAFCAQMRQQRPEMVQTEQQYIFIYQAILEHQLYGDTEVEASEVSVHLDELMERLPGNVTGMEHEFKKLTSIRIQKEHMRAGNHPANMRKNRVLLILPYDWNRVMLPIKRGQENTDYVNASYIDGYRSKDAYIATQGPLPHTIEDFWRMIWDSQSASIVMLTELVERGQGKCAQYWPNDGVMLYGDVKVELITTKENEDYTERDFKISNETPSVTREQIVKQFHYHGWPEVGAPVSGYSMIELVEAVQKQQQTSGNHPIVIHCSAGAGRTGAFCALTTALEQVKAEGVLDMFQIVKCLRMQRPHMVQNLEQYEFCYHAVQEYIDSMSEYYNFK